MSEMTMSEVAMPEMAEPNIRADQFQACLLGLATGDALGAPYEGGPLEHLLWRCIGRTQQGEMRWTDDTQMSLDLAQSLLACKGVNLDDLAQRFAHSYHWNRGYGPSAARLLKRIRRGQDWQSAATAIYPQGSFGNGAAMRAAVLGMYFAGKQADLIAATRSTSAITHAHPLGIEGGLIIAIACNALLHQANAEDVLLLCRQHCTQTPLLRALQLVQEFLIRPPSSKVLAQRLGNQMTALSSVPTALYLALAHLHRPFNDLIQAAIAVRGDVDTIASMAGSLWGAYRGSAELPVIALEQRALLQQVATDLYAQYSQCANCAAQSNA